MKAPWPLGGLLAVRAGSPSALASPTRSPRDIRELAYVASVFEATAA